MQLTRLFKDSNSNLFWIRLGLYVTIIGLFVMNIIHILANWGIILLSVVALFQFINTKRLLKSFGQSKYFTPFLFIFCLFCISLLFTEKQNLPELGHYFEKRLLFFALPFSFIILPTFPKKIYLESFGLFFILALITACQCTINFYLHKTEIIQAYVFSNTLPTPVHHVRYSLMICYAIFLGLYLLYNVDTNRFKITIRILLCFGIIFLVFFLHLLAVRSGLLAFYSIAVVGMIYFLTKRNYSYLLALTASSLLLIYFSLQHLETVQTKIGNTIYDLYQSSTHSQESYNYSLSRRVISNQVAFELFKQNPWIGTGEANLNSEMNKIYRTDYPAIHQGNYIAPHNQFLTILASLGVIGFLIFFTCFYYPLFYKKSYRFLPLLTIYLILTISFLSEDTLQTQLGYMFGLFFIMLNLHFLKSNLETSETVSSNNNL
jgi:O-antigen ligase